MADQESKVENKHNRNEVTVQVTMIVPKEGEAGANISQMLEPTGIKIVPDYYLTPEGAPDGYQYYVFVGTAPEVALEKDIPGISLLRLDAVDQERDQQASESGHVFYGEFDLRDYRFQSEYGDKEGRPFWFLTITHNQEPVRQDEIPMLHRPTFGPDVEDVETLEETTDKIIKELGLE